MPKLTDRLAKLGSGLESSLLPDAELAPPQLVAPVPATAETVVFTPPLFLADQTSQDEDDEDDEPSPLELSDDDFPEDEDDDLPEEDQFEIQFLDLLTAYFKLVPSPTDEQFHKLAESLNLDYQLFEEKVYALLGSMLSNEDISEDVREEIL